MPQIVYKLEYTPIGPAPPTQFWLAPNKAQTT